MALRTFQKFWSIADKDARRDQTRKKIFFKVIQADTKPVLRVQQWQHVGRNHESAVECLKVTVMMAVFRESWRRRWLDSGWPRDPPPDSPPPPTGNLITFMWALVFDYTEGMIRLASIVSVKKSWLLCFFNKLFLLHSFIHSWHGCTSVGDLVHETRARATSDPPKPHPRVSGRKLITSASKFAKLGRFACRCCNTWCRIRHTKRASSLKEWGIPAFTRKPDCVKSL